MATRTPKKMTKLKQAYFVPKTKTKWKLSQPQIVTLVTGVGVSTSSEMEKSKSHGLKVLNDMVAIEEEPVDFEVDKPSGLTSDVVSMVKSGGLVLPEVAEFYAKKYPCIGKVVERGPKASHEIKIGNRVLFARHGGLREQVDGKDYVFIRSCDVHAILD